MRREPSNIPLSGHHCKSQTASISLSPYADLNCRSIDKTAEKVGLPNAGDYNDPNAPAMGFFHFEAAIDGSGRRISAYKAFLDAGVAWQRRQRLSVCKFSVPVNASVKLLDEAEHDLGTGATASRLELESETETVNGVYFQSSLKGSTPEEFFVKARREVVLCAGAICSAQVLLLSGVGPMTKQSGTSSDLNIPLIEELPAVGTRFADHYSFPIMLEVPKNETFHVLESLWGLWHILLWLLFGKGLMSVTSMLGSFYIRTDAIDAKTMTVRARGGEGVDNFDASQPTNSPDVEIMVMPVNGLERHVPGHSLLTLYPTLIQPHGTGRIELIR